MFLVAETPTPQNYALRRVQRKRCEITRDVLWLSPEGVASEEKNVTET
jgi:hypothetical protein